MRVKMNMAGIDMDKVGKSQFVDAPGWYRATIEKWGMNDREDSHQVLFRVTAPAHSAGQGHTEYITLPEWAKDDEAGQKVTARIAGICKRLGVPIDEDGSFDTDDAIGVECVIQIKLDTYQGKSKLKLDYLGVYPLDYEKFTDAVRKELGLPAPKPGAGAGDGAAGGAGRAGRGRRAASPPPHPTEDELGGL